MALGSNAVASGGSIASGSALTLTASVTAGSTKLTVGQVNFCDASATNCTDIHLLGTAQLTSAGTAVFRFHPAIGNHSYKAQFAGTPNSASSTAPSVSSPLALTVTGTFPTTTSIAAAGIAGNYSLTATVTGQVNSIIVSGPTGTVSFVDTTNNNASLATPALGNSVLAPALVNVSNPQTGTGPNSIVTGDFDGDGNLDLAVADGQTSPTVTILLGDGTGNFAAVTKSPITATGSPKAVRDFNGDGIPDLLLSDQSHRSFISLLGNGDGTFNVAPGSPISTVYGVAPIVVADFNGDGIPDFAAAGAYYLVVQLGKGDGSFTDVPIGPSSIPQAELFDSMVVGDLNGDGITDLAVLDTTFQQTVLIFLSNGDGTFSQGTSITVSPTSGGGSLSSLAIGDFNQDGKLDLAVPVFGNVKTVAVLLGNGNGTFQAPFTSPMTIGSTPFFSVAGDFNGDGIADLFFGAQINGTTLNVLLGNGDGTFSHMPTGTAQLPCCSNTIVGDFNGDGLTDIATSSSYYNLVQILSTQWTQTATATATGIAPMGTGIHQVDASYPGDTTYSSSVSATTGLTATGFTIAGTAVSVAPGAITGNTSTITVTPSGNLVGNVALTATITSGPTGALYPPTLTFGATGQVSITGTASGTATLTIATTPATTSGLVYPEPRGVPWYAAGGVTLACIFFFGIPRQQRSWRSMLGMLALLLTLSCGILACAGGTAGGSGGGHSIPGTTAGSYTVTITATSGAITQTGAVSLTVQ